VRVHAFGVLAHGAASQTSRLHRRKVLEAEGIISTNKPAIGGTLVGASRSFYKKPQENQEINPQYILCLGPHRHFAVHTPRVSSMELPSPYPLRNLWTEATAVGNEERRGRDEWRRPAGRTAGTGRAERGKTE
jgi:hypothetical protein